MEDGRTDLILRPLAQVYSSYKEYQRQKDADVRAVTIGRFIACRVRYDKDSKVSKKSQQKFWVGKVVNTSEDTVTFHYYHTSQTVNLSRAVYKPWTGSGQHVEVGHDAVIDVFDALTGTGLLPAPHRRFILSKVQTGMTSGPMDDRSRPSGDEDGELDIVSEVDSASESSVVSNDDKRTRKPSKSRRRKRVPNDDNRTRKTSRHKRARGTTSKKTKKKPKKTHKRRRT